MSDPENGHSGYREFVTSTAGREILYITTIALVLISPFAIGLRGASLLLMASAAVLALVTYADGGLAGCSVLFGCSTGAPYNGFVASFAVGLVLLIYLGVALAAPVVLLLRLLGFKKR